MILHFAGITDASELALLGSRCSSFSSVGRRRVDPDDPALHRFGVYIMVGELAGSLQRSASALKKMIPLS